MRYTSKTRHLDWPIIHGSLRPGVSLQHPSEAKQDKASSIHIVDVKVHRSGHVEYEVNEDFQYIARELEIHR